MENSEKIKIETIDLEVKNAIDCQIEWYNKKVNELNNYSHTKIINEIKFTLKQISNENSAFFNDNKFPNTDKYIYLIFIDKIDNLQSLYLNAKREKTNFKFSRLNKKNFYNNSNKCLYVGSSNKLSYRFKEHCGFVSESTYALRFNEWITDDYELIFTYFKVDNNQELLQNIEDALHNYYKPLFGKQGSNSK